MIGISFSTPKCVSIRELKHDVYAKRQKLIKLLPSVNYQPFVH